MTDDNEVSARLAALEGFAVGLRERLAAAETRIGLLRDQVDAMALTDSDDDVRIEDRVEALEQRAQTTVTFDDL